MALTQALPKIDDRTYQDIVAEARTRIPAYTKEWTDFNEGDPGIALIQLMAWMSELMLFRMNRVPELAYVKFLDLIGITLTPARPAEVLVSVAAQKGWPQGTIDLPPRSQIAAPAADGDGTVIFETSRRLVVFSAELDAVQTYVGGVYIDQTAANQAAETPWSPFTDSGDPGTALVLGFTYDGAFPARTELALTFWLAAGNGLGPVTCGAAPVAPGTRLVWEAFDGRDWRAVSLLKDETGALTRSGQVFLRTPDPGLMNRAILGAKVDARATGCASGSRSRTGTGCRNCWRCAPTPCAPTRARPSKARSWAAATVLPGRPSPCRAARCSTAPWCCRSTKATASPVDRGRRLHRRRT